MEMLSTFIPREVASLVRSSEINRAQNPRISEFPIMFPLGCPL
jgi:hypothetical protein